MELLLYGSAYNNDYMWYHSGNVANAIFLATSITKRPLVSDHPCYKDGKPNTVKSTRRWLFRQCRPYLTMAQTSAAVIVRSWATTTGQEDRSVLRYQILILASHPQRMNREWRVIE